MAALTDLLNKIPKPIRDAAEIAIAALAVAIADYLTGVIDANPTAFGVWTGVVVVAIGMFRRWLAPAPTPQLALFSPSFSSFDDNGLNHETPALGTPVVADGTLGAPLVLMSQDDDDFVSDCASQIPLSSAGDVKQFNPAVIVSILMLLFQNWPKILELIDAVKDARWWDFWSLLGLRRAIKQAIKEASPTGMRGNSPDGFEKWLLKADKTALGRLQRIAMARR